MREEIVPNGIKGEELLSSTESFQGFVVIQLSQRAHTEPHPRAITSWKITSI